MINFANSYHKYVNRFREINVAAKEAPAELVCQVEHSYQMAMHEVIDDALALKNGCKVIMLAGPSSSGKTTTAHRLMGELQTRGIESVLISLDDFFMGEGKAPMLENGDFDYEDVRALDLEQVESSLLSLMNKGFCDKPEFDFYHKEPFPNTKRLELKEDGIAIVEGIHALNPLVTAHLPSDKVLKIYVSVKQGIKDGDEVILSPRNLRLIRRLVRDYHFRNTDPENTLLRWNGVCRGENLYIQPFKRTSDITINSIHIYEPCILRHDALNLLSTIEKSSGAYDTAAELMEKLKGFEEISDQLVPQESLMREFIGGGLYS